MAPTASAQGGAPEVFRRILKLAGGRPYDLADEIARLRRWLTADRDKRPSGYMNDPRAFSAYLSFHLPLHLPELFWILDRLKKDLRVALAPPKHLVDLGCGPGTSTLSALLWLESQKLKQPERIEALDLSRRALKSAQDLMEVFVPPERLKLRRGNLFSKRERAHVRGPADWLLLSHVLNELGSGPRVRERKLELLATLAREFLGGPGSLFFIIEPPLREPTLDLMWLRDAIRSGEDPFWEEHFEIIAPCPAATRYCSLARVRGGWCYAQPPRQWARDQGLAPWDREIEDAAGGIELSHPGFSYLVLRHKEVDREAWSSRHGLAISDDSRTRGWECRGPQTATLNRPVAYRGAYRLLGVEKPKPPTKP